MESLIHRTCRLTSAKDPPPGVIRRWTDSRRVEQGEIVDLEPAVDEILAGGVCEASFLLRPTS